MIIDFQQLRKREREGVEWKLYTERHRVDTENHRVSYTIKFVTCQEF